MDDLLGDRRVPDDLQRVAPERAPVSPEELRLRGAISRAEPLHQGLLIALVIRCRHAI